MTWLSHSSVTILDFRLLQRYHFPRSDFCSGGLNSSRSKEVEPAKLCRCKQVQYSLPTKDTDIFILAPNPSGSLRSTWDNGELFSRGEDGRVGIERNSGRGFVEGQEVFDLSQSILGGGFEIRHVDADIQEEVSVIARKASLRTSPPPGYLCHPASSSASTYLRALLTVVFSAAPH